MHELTLLVPAKFESESLPIVIKENSKILICLILFLKNWNFKIIIGIKWKKIIEDIISNLFAGFNLIYEFISLTALEVRNIISKINK